MRCWNCLAVVRVVPPHFFLWPECTLWVGESCLENRTQPELSVTVIAFDRGGLKYSRHFHSFPQAQSGRKARQTGMAKALDQRSTILSPFLITPCWTSMLITSLSYLGTVITSWLPVEDSHIGEQCRDFEEDRFDWTEVSLTCSPCVCSCSVSIASRCSLFRLKPMS